MRSVLWYILSLPIALLRAIYLRLVRGSPSKILKFGTYNDTHMDDMHYPSHLTFKEPLDEEKLRKALATMWVLREERRDRSLAIQPSPVGECLWLCAQWLVPCSAALVLHWPFVSDPKRKIEPESYNRAEWLSPNETLLIYLFLDLMRSH